MRQITKKEESLKFRKQETNRDKGNIHNNGKEKTQDKLCIRPEEQLVKFGTRNKVYKGVEGY